MANPISLFLDKFQLIDLADGSKIIFIDGQIKSDDFDPDNFKTVYRNGVNLPIASNSILLVRDTTKVWVYDMKAEKWSQLGGN